ncbi:MAG TPA: flavodoxin domain-containing protein [Acidimicrobiales bacterium]|nr:flavodoxin domain-containing protein [Acidimicrobiales bacterium]
MRAVVVYESMYGNTHAVAQAIADGLGPPDQVAVLPVDQAKGEVLRGADLVVVGGPTHAHGMSRAGTRKAAIDAAERPDSGLALDPAAGGSGLREWLSSLQRVDSKAAAFDTRFRAPSIFTGRASKGIGRALRRHGCELVARPESFYVDKGNRLRAGEAQRALAWGKSLAEGRRRSAEHVRPGGRSAQTGPSPRTSGRSETETG